MAVIKWDPRRHPRDAEGRFAKVIESAKVATERKAIREAQYALEDAVNGPYAGMPSGKPPPQAPRPRRGRTRKQRSPRGR